ncbi:hypothetical protein [Corynebacterium macclintockiae]|uniref:hypothetical protein n=1 Tax=Corynebacterium macclintockiae TaxID=2913501 RepID=UPI003EBED773
MAPYVPIPAGFHDVVYRQIMRYGTDLAAEICGLSTQTLLVYASPDHGRTKINEATLDLLVTRFNLDPNFFTTPQGAA